MSSSKQFYGSIDVQFDQHSKVKLASQLANNQPPPEITFCKQQSTSGSINTIAEKDENVNNIKKKKHKLIKGKKDVLVIISMAIDFFFALCAFSVIAPFFRLEGKKKGVSTSITGLIFAVHPLFVFLVSPIVGKFLPVIGPKFCLIAGTFLEGGSQILFGFVEDISDYTTFVVFSFLIRIVTAIGAACCQTAVLTVMVITFKENMATIFGMLELFSSLGLMAGPAIGGVLYKSLKCSSCVIATALFVISNYIEVVFIDCFIIVFETMKVGGFKLPFIFVGGVLLLSDIAVYFILPSEEELKNSSDEGETDNEKVESVMAVLRVPGVFMMSIVTISGSMVLSFLDPTLTDHLQDVSNNSLGSEKIGLFFMITGGLYTVCSPPLGYLTDTRLDGRYCIMFGHFVVFAAYFFLGPSPLLSSFIKPKLWLVGVSLALNGFGIAPFIVPNLADMSISASNAGLPDNLGIKGILSGIFWSCFSIGSVIGPTLGGFLTDHLSFDWASTIFSFIVLLEGIILFFFTIWERNSRWYKKRNYRTDTESSEPLLSTELISSKF